jgi:hypothetical protein
MMKEGMAKTAKGSPQSSSMALPVTFKHQPGLTMVRQQTRKHPRVGCRGSGDTKLWPEDPCLLPWIRNKG